MKRGFTLVELLVVIGIIALLISILLPSLIRAQQAANRVRCASNQRQILLGLHMYARDWQDRVPIATSRTNPAWTVFWAQDSANTPGGMFMGLGLLYQAGYIKDLRVFYSPAATGPARGTGNASFQRGVVPGYRHDVPDQLIPGQLSATGTTTYFSFVPRPMSGHTLNSVSTATGTQLHWFSQGMPKMSQFRPNGVPTTFNIPAVNGTGGERFRFGPAIIASPHANSRYIVTNHKRGINVGFADGSVRWVRHDVFANLQAPWEPTNPNFAPDIQSSTTTPTEARRSALFQMWYAFDQE